MTQISSQTVATIDKEFINQLSKEEATKLISKMLLNQASLNTKSYNTAWVDKGKSLEFDYSLAASQEIGEFITSFGYSWWSKSPQDLSNCRTEIVDAVHFMLSQSIIDSGIIEVAEIAIHKAYVDSFDYTLKYDTKKLAKMLQARLNTNLSCIEQTSDLYTSPWTLLLALAQSISFSFEHLYIRYIGKSLLNAFRQEQNYKKGVFKFGEPGEGKYLKLWDGVKEDNYFLAEWLDTFNIEDVQPTEIEIKQWLTTNYNKWLYESNRVMET